MVIFKRLLDEAAELVKKGRLHPDRITDGVTVKGKHTTYLTISQAETLYHKLKGSLEEYRQKEGRPVVLPSELTGRPFQVVEQFDPWTELSFDVFCARNGIELHEEVRR
jgi:hypothetical protein